MYFTREKIKMWLMTIAPNYIYYRDPSHINKTIKSKTKSIGFSEDRTHDLLLTRETLLPLSHEAN